MAERGWARRTLARRTAEREAKVEQARRFVQELSGRIDVAAAYVYGSVARGDFNVWSDTDVLVVARGLAVGQRERLSTLTERAPPGVQAIAWTPEEHEAELSRGNPIALEAREHGIPLTT